jgi:alpha-glutamyl/putrescinyl thymine pyrophosphorylase clade 1
VNFPQAQSIIYNFVEEQEAYFKGLKYEPVTLLGRRLHAIDCQNLFCETDKYARVAHPEFKVKDGERIKQTLKPIGSLPTPFFPPKRNIN